MIVYGAAYIHKITFALQSFGKLNSKSQISFQAKETQVLQVFNFKILHKGSMHMGGRKN